MLSSSLSALPPACRMARMSELNSWPPGIPLKIMPVSVPSASSLKLTGEVSAASACSMSERRGEVATICARKVFSSSRLACSPVARTRVISRLRAAKYWRTVSSMAWSSCMRVPCVGLRLQKQRPQALLFCFMRWRCACAGFRFCRRGRGSVSAFPVRLPKRRGKLRRRAGRRIVRH